MDADGSTWMFCPDCYSEISEEYSEEFAKVNASILEDGSEEDED